MRRILLSLAMFAALVSPAAAVEPSASKRLIEFGWDEPDTSFLRAHSKLIESTPFDGCVFHVDARDKDGKPAGSLTWQAWGTRAFTDDELKQAREDLEAAAKSSTRATTHFLRFNTAPAKLDWFDDHSAVMSNARQAARLARLGKARGILFDTEQYEGQLFDFSKQRDSKSKSFSVYAAQARRRGRELMTAFQTEFPDLHVLITFGHTWPWRQLKGRPAKDLEHVADGLLAPFLDGMLDAASGQSRLIDGYEISYGYRERSAFEKARETMKRDVAPIVGNLSQYEKHVSVGFGLWMDYDWRVKGWNETDLSKNHFTPEVFETSVRTALELADEYVWIYTEQPRWWTVAGKSEKLPQAYVDAVRRARSEAGPITPPKPK